MRQINKSVRSALSLEQLERREVPIVGLAAFGNVAPLGGTGGDYDGVVAISRADTSGTGAILSNPMYILTAAHVVGKDNKGVLELPASKVYFEFQRTGGAVGSIPVEVPAGEDYLSVSPAWNPARDKQSDDADIGIITLPDQNAATRAAGRVMIAPYRSTPWGGNRYDVFAGAVVGKQFSMVGYGQTGKGPDGNYNDRVDRVTIPAPLPGVGNDFTITIGVGAASKTTAKLSQTAATAAQVATALNAADPPAAGQPDNYLVMQVAAGIYDIRFSKNKSQGQDGGGVTAITRYDGALAVGAAVPIQNRWVGAQTAGTKRSGENEFDRTKAGNVKILEFDFDNQAKGVNPFGTAGLGGLETNIAPGDSGGPGIIRFGGVPQIAGVASYITTFPIGAANTDATPYVDGGGVPYADSSIGEQAAYTHVQPYMAGYVTPYITKKVDLILDMNFQTYGYGSTDGKDGRPVRVAGEKVEIFVRKVGANLEIEVKGGDAALDGIYAKVDASTIKSLTIRGSDDNEIVKIDGPLGFAAGSKAIVFEGGEGDDELIISGLQGAVAAGDIGEVRFDGGAGTDKITVNDAAGIGNGNTYTFKSPDAPAVGVGWTQRIDRTNAVVAGVAVVFPSIDTKLVEYHSLLAGTGNDVIKVLSASGTVLIAGGAGNDDVTIGDATNGIANVLASVGVLGEAGDDKLIIEDSASAVARTYEIGAAVAAPGWKGEVRRADLVGGVRTLFSIERVELKSGTKGDTINVTTLDASVSGGLTIKGNDGDDTFTVGSAAKGLDDIGAVVNIDGEAGNNSLVVDDTAGKAGVGKYKVNILPGPFIPPAPGNIRLLATPNAPFIEFQKIQTPPAANGKSLTFRGRVDGSEIQLAGLAAETTFEYVGNNGTDRLVVGAENADDVFSTFTFSGDSGTDEVLMLNGSLVDPALSAVEALNLSGGLFTGDNAFDVVTWTGGTLSGTPSGAVAISGSSPKALSASSTLANTGNGTWTGGSITGGGTLRNLFGASLSADGALVGLFDNRGSLTLDTLAVSGGFTQTATGSLYFDLGDDTLTVNGSVTLAGELVVYGTPTESVYTVISHDGSSPITGRFDGMPEGVVTIISGVAYRLSYLGGDGNDLTLTRVAGSVVPVGLFPTGVNGSGSLLADGVADPHYQLIGAGDLPRPATTVIADGFPIGPWLANSSTSRWIAPVEADADANAAPGEYVYRTTFTLSGLNLASVTVSGTWAADNTARIVLNGVDTGVTISSPEQFGTLAAFALSRGFVAGTNTLDFVVTNAGTSANPTGLRVDSVTATALPGSYTTVDLFDTGVDDGHTALPDDGALPVSGLESTGVGADGQPLPHLTLDPTFTVTSAPIGYTGAAKVLTSAGGFPVGPWVGDGGGSAWVVPAEADDDGTAPAGEYVFTTTLTVNAGSGWVLSGRWAADNSARVRVNGVDTGVVLSGSESFHALTRFDLPGSLFTVGTNTIDFVVTNGGTDPSPVGLRVEWDLTPSAVDPHFTVTGPDGVTQAAKVVREDGFPTPPWLPNTAATRWISPYSTDSDGNAAPGEYVYRTTFDLTGLDAATAVLTGLWAADNFGVDIRLNGVSLGLTHGGENPGTGVEGFRSLSRFAIAAESGAAFQTGVNVLEFVVRNDQYSAGNLTPNPVGLFVADLLLFAVPVV